MSVNSVAVAKASLIAPFVRPDPTAVSRDEVNVFHDLLDAVLLQCSPTNIQKCRQWLSQNVTSATRVSAIGKYLTTLSASFPLDDERQGGGIKGKTNTRRKRLHILYLINDWLHGAYHHESNGLDSSTVGKALQQHLVALVVSASSYDTSAHPRLYRRHKDLLEQWDSQGYYDTEFIATLKDAATGTNKDIRLEDDSSRDDFGARQTDEATPYIMPSQHGDPSAPWYDLPAANMLPCIEPNSARPIDPRLLKPLYLNAEPADSSLIALVQDLLKDADVLYKADVPLEEGVSLDYDELGQQIFRSSDGQDISYGKTYYGWSKDFCERMRGRLREERSASANRHSRERSVSRGRGYSSSASSRASTRKRSRSRSNSQRRSRRRATRSPSPHALRRSRTRSHSSEYHKRGRYRTRSRSQNRDQSYSPPAVPQTFPRPIPSGTSLIPPPPPPLPTGSQYMIAPHQFPPSFGPTPAFPPAGLPTPPPRPPNWVGSWPPPPPPLGGGAPLGFPPFGPGFGQDSGSAPLHPPPPPSSYHGNWNQQAPPRERRW